LALLVLSFATVVGRTLSIQDERRRERRECIERQLTEFYWPLIQSLKLDTRFEPVRHAKWSKADWERTLGTIAESHTTLPNLDKAF
jgi:hypothetical protein